MPLRLAKIAAASAFAVGVVAIPTLYATPPPLQLCVLAPPFNCISSQWSGAQYVEGDSPMALVWLVTSFILAPLLSLVAVRLVARGQRARGLIFATGGVFPNLLLFFGTYAFIPLHLVVLALTVGTLTCLVLSANRPADAAASRRRLA
jgi:hypothetical protein